MICGTCGTDNPGGSKFCLECGARLVETCPTCGAPRLENAKFCGECGTSFAAPGASPASANGPPAPSSAGGTSVPVPPPTERVAERRLVSVLFADLVGFTTLAEGRDAEAVRELLSRYFDLARTIVERYGGTVEKFIGDAVMAVWGTPTAHEDDAERAVRAALDLVDEVRSLGPSVSARAGVLTGEAAVTIGATGEGMVAGDLVNTASRLQSVAPSGAVLVGQSTQRAAAAAISFEPAGDQTLKGKEAPVPAFRALRVVAERGGVGRAEGLEAPFVGREEEVRLLKDLFHATSREKRTRLVSITGQAGVGKSRLLWELSKYLDGVAETIWYHEGRSPAYGEGITFWALGEMVRTRAQLAEREDEATCQKLAAAVAQWVPDEAERPWILDSLLALLGFEEPRGSREQLFAAWRTFFERIAQQGPVVLVFKDLQWSDDGLLDFIDHVLEWSRGVPIFIVTLARPDLLERRPSWGAGRRNFVALTLDPLPEGAMQELLAGLVPGLPGPSVRTIVGRAAGIPLYAIETVRMLVSEGKLEEYEGAYRPTADVTEIAVPETLHALIAARLDALDPTDRSLLQDAAVLGQTFTTAALAAVSGTGPAALETRLRPLVRSEILNLEVNPRSPERGQWGFVQGLIREVAYSTLSRKDRRTRHLAAARYFESLEDEEIAGALAGHYLAAYRAGPEGPEGEALAVQARIALRAAAERAARLGAHAQAVAFLEDALTLTSDLAERADILMRAGQAATLGARLEVTERLLTGAIEAYRTLGDRAAAAAATTALGRAFLPELQVDRAVALFEAARQEYADIDRSPEYVALLGQLARGYNMQERRELATEWSDRALEAAERLDLVDVVADALITKGSAMANTARAYEGLTLLDGAERLARSNGLVLAQLRARGNITAQLISRDPRQALEIAREGLELARRYGLAGTASIMAANGIEAALHAGEWDWALSELAEIRSADLGDLQTANLLQYEIAIRSFRGEDVVASLAELRRLVPDDSSGAAWGIRHAAEAWAALAAHDFQRAYQAARALEEISPINAPSALTIAARAALGAGTVSRAREAVERIEALGIHGPSMDAERRSLLAGVAALEGRVADAVPGYREALRRFRELRAEFDLALSALDFAVLLPDEPEARDAGEEARRIFTRLGARPFMERLDMLPSAPPPVRGRRRAAGEKRTEERPTGVIAGNPVAEPDA